MKIILDLANETDLDLNDILRLIQAEQERRIKVKLTCGDYSRPSEEEMSLAKTDRVKAIKAYRDRNECSLAFAASVIQRHLAT